MVKDKDKNLVRYVAVYHGDDSATPDLDAIEGPHEDGHIGTFESAVVDKELERPHVVKRMGRPRTRVMPAQLGLGRLSRRELHEAAAELNDNDACLIMIGEPTLERAFDKAVTRAVTRPPMGHIIRP